MAPAAPSWAPARSLRSRQIAHPDNHFYGHNRVLADYVGIGADVPVIWGHVQHGWSEGHGLMLRPRLVRWLPKFVYSSANRQAALDDGIKPAVPIGGPFCYLATQERARLGGPAPRSTIAYPSHSWERDEMQGSHDALIAAISEREEGPVTVCLYWREYDQLEVRRVYEAAGFRVVCHGYRSDPHFMRRQFDELLLHDRVVTNRVATALWYGGLVGRALEVYGPVFGVQGADEVESWDRFQRRQWPMLFDGGVDGATAADLAADELGAAHVRPPEELAEILGWTGRKPTLGPLVRGAAHAEHQVRRVVYNVRLRLPGGSKLLRFK